MFQQRLAKYLVLQSFRNSTLKDLHSGTLAGVSVTQFVGVNQLNVTVPNVRSGVVPLQINDLDTSSSDNVTIAVEQ